jgi:hypothetical protein
MTNEEKTCASGQSVKVELQDFNLKQRGPMAEVRLASAARRRGRQTGRAAISV